MRVLFVTADRLGHKRAGPAIRCLELAKVLAKSHEVVVASAQPGELAVEGISFLFDATHHHSELRHAAVEANVVVAQGLVLAQFPFLRRMSRFLVVDLYDPYLFEYLAHPHRRFPNWGYLRQWHLLNQQLLAGDFFLCANERQRDYWLGRLCALGRLNPENYAQDSRFQRLVAAVPFGISSLPPQHGVKPVLKGQVPGIDPEDMVLLWAGGIWEWFDPLTIIRAVQIAHRENPRVKLVFLGTEDPNPANRPMPMVERAQNEAKELSLLGHSVFFLPGWVPFENRQDYLLESDLGVSAHRDSIETRFAFRTRVLDYIWSGLPMLLTSGDYFAEWAERECTGFALPPEDVAAWGKAILQLASSPGLRAAMKKRLAALAPRFTWDNVAQPLVEYCAAPYRTTRTSRLNSGLTGFLAPMFQRLRR